jgi:hypothetical protein
MYLCVVWHHISFHYISLLLFQTLVCYCFSLYVCHQISFITLLCFYVCFLGPWQLGNYVHVRCMASHQFSLHQFVTVSVCMYVITSVFITLLCFYVMSTVSVCMHGITSVFITLVCYVCHHNSFGYISLLRMPSYQF